MLLLMFKQSIVTAQSPVEVNACRLWIDSE